MRNKEKYIELLEKSLSFFPATQRNLIVYLQKQMDERDKVLDIGCGLKWITKHLVCNDLIGIDIYSDYLTNKDICGNITKVTDYFTSKSFDFAIAIDVIEHLEKNDGTKLLIDLQKIVRKKVFVTTPTFWTENKQAVDNQNLWSCNNSYNSHKSFWEAKDFQKLGYKIANVDFCNELILAEKEIING